MLNITNTHSTFVDNFPLTTSSYTEQQAIKDGEQWILTMHELMISRTHQNIPVTSNVSQLFDQILYKWMDFIMLNPMYHRAREIAQSVLVGDAKYIEDAKRDDLSRQPRDFIATLLSAFTSIAPKHMIADNPDFYWHINGALCNKSLELDFVYQTFVRQYADNKDAANIIMRMMSTHDKVTKADVLGNLHLSWKWLVICNRFQFTQAEIEQLINTPDIPHHASAVTEAISHHSQRAKVMEQLLIPLIMHSRSAFIKLLQYDFITVDILRRAKNILCASFALQLKNGIDLTSILMQMIELKVHGKQFSLTNVLDDDIFIWFECMMPGFRGDTSSYHRIVTGMHHYSGINMIRPQCSKYVVEILLEHRCITLDAITDFDAEDIHWTPTPFKPKLMAQLATHFDESVTAQEFADFLPQIRKTLIGVRGSSLLTIVRDRVIDTSPKSSSPLSADTMAAVTPLVDTCVSNLLKSNDDGIKKDKVLSPTGSDSWVREVGIFICLPRAIIKRYRLSADQIDQLVRLFCYMGGFDTTCEQREYVPSILATVRRFSENGMVCYKEVIAELINSNTDFVSPRALFYCSPRLSLDINFWDMLRGNNYWNLYLNTYSASIIFTPAQLMLWKAGHKLNQTIALAQESKVNYAITAPPCLLASFIRQRYLGLVSNVIKRKWREWKVWKADNKTEREQKLDTETTVNGIGEDGYLSLQAMMNEGYVDFGDTETLSGISDRLEREYERIRRLKEYFLSKLALSEHWTPKLEMMVERLGKTQLPRDELWQLLGEKPPHSFEMSVRRERAIERSYRQVNFSHLAITNLDPNFRVFDFWNIWS